MARSEDFTQDANGRDGRVVTTLPVVQDFSPELGGSDGLISVASDAHCVWLLVNPTTGEKESSWFSLVNGDDAEMVRGEERCEENGEEDVTGRTTSG